MTHVEHRVEKTPTVEPEMAEDRPVFVPAADIYERADAVLVRCDMPGVDEGRVDVTLEDGVLTLTGHQEEAAVEQHDLVAGEYRTGIFRRAFRISNEIDPAGIKARIRHGVLELELAKSKQAQPRKIAVVAEE